MIARKDQTDCAPILSKPAKIANLRSVMESHLHCQQQNGQADLERKDQVRQGYRQKDPLHLRLKDQARPLLAYLQKIRKFMK